MARRATIIQETRAQAEHMLLLDAGDALFYDRNPGKATRGASSVEAMNMLGYDAATLGMVELADLTAAELAQRQAEAEFPFLAANVTVGATGENATEPFVIIDMADHRVAILGVTEEGKTESFSASDPVAAVQAYLPKLRQEADLVILLSHAGQTIDEEIAGRFPGIDLIVGGGQRMPDEPITNAATGTIRVHADTARPGEAGRAVGIARLMVSPEGEITQHVWERIWLLPEVEREPVMAEWLLEQNRKLQEGSEIQ